MLRGLFGSRHHDERWPVGDTGCTTYDLEDSRVCAQILRRTLVAMIYDAYKL